MINRDMMYGSYYQNIPGSMFEGSYNVQLPPGALMQGNMMNPIMELNNRITMLENRIKLIEEKINGSSFKYQDDNSLYMI